MTRPPPRSSSPSNETACACFGVEESLPVASCRGGGGGGGGGAMPVGDKGGAGALPVVEGAA